jgi:4-hydroxy-tetrahydrodipicolinate reductase
MALDGSVVKVAVVGAAGKMGRESIKAITRQNDMEVVAAIDHQCVDEPVKSLIGNEGPDLSVRSKVGEALDETRPDVLLDFTHASCAPEHALSALKRKIAVVIGASGLSSADLQVVKESCVEHETACLLVPNFALGAVLMMRFAEIAAKWLPNAEVIELHHPAKADAPSGTALHTAKVIQTARASAPREAHSIEKAEGARGAQVDGVRIHSVRLPGLLAHQEVLFGGAGETLTIRHDSMDRTSFMDGVLLACREVRSLSGLVVGLDKVMFR